MRSLMRILFVVMLASVPVIAQAPMFEVASVKRSPRNVSIIEASLTAPAPGHLRFQGTELYVLVPWAYDIPLAFAHQFQIEWGPHREMALREQFDIEAKGDPDNDIKAMLRTLLGVRFSLRTHTERREVAGYALVAKEPGKLGPYLRPTTTNCRAWSLLPPPRPEAPKECVNASRIRRFGTGVMFGAGAITELIQSRLQGGFQIPIVDATGLAGNFAWEFAAESRPREGSGVPNFVTAIEDQLGLKLERRTVPVDVLVIDDVQMPTEN